MALPGRSRCLGVGWALRELSVPKSSRGDGFNAPGPLLPFPVAVVCVVLEYCLLGSMPFCDFQAGTGFLAVVSAVSWSLCWAEAVPPLAKRRRGRPQGLQEGCSESSCSEPGR